jgi:hypothetical protein
MVNRFVVPLSVTYLYGEALQDRHSTHGEVHKYLKSYSHDTEI